MKSNQVSKFEYLGYSLLAKAPKSLKERGIVAYSKLMFQKINRLKTPLNLIFYITNRCNGRCKHCFYWKNLNKIENELTLSQIRGVASSLKHPLELLAITGGEPFLRDDIEEICNIFYKINRTKRIAIDTNGLLTGVIYKKINQLLTQNPKKRLTILVSLDGLEKTHDKIRNFRGGFKKTIETVRKLKELETTYKNLTIFILTTIQKDNVKEVPKLIKYVKDELKVMNKFNILRGTKNVYNVNKNILSEFDPPFSKMPILADLEKSYLKIKENAVDIPSKVESLKVRYSIDMLKNKKGCIKCLAGKTEGVIFSNGDISICEPTKPFANLKDTNYNFFKIWNSSEANKMRSQLKNCFCLQSCNLLNAMRYDPKTIMRL